jgi:hypothetical protein
MKGAEAVMLLNLTLPLMMLVAWTVCEGLVVPTLTLPKARLVGLSFSDCALASAGAAKPIKKRSAKLKTENVKVDNLGRDMINPPETYVCESAPLHLPSPK